MVCSLVGGGMFLIPCLKAFFFEFFGVNGFPSDNIIPPIFSGIPIRLVNWLWLQSKLPPTSFGAPIRLVNWLWPQVKFPTTFSGAPIRLVNRLWL